MDKYKVIKILRNLCRSYECYEYTDEENQKDIRDYDEYDFMMGPYWKETVKFLKELEGDS